MGNQQTFNQIYVYDCEKKDYQSISISNFEFGRFISKGGMRAAFLCSFNIKNEKFTMVAKKYYNEDTKTNNRKINEDIFAQTLCNSYAEIFNDINTYNKKIEFLKPYLFVDDKGCSWLLEKLLRGTFRKWTNNTGFVDNSNMTPISFSHWVFDNYGFLICDLQGITEGNKYLLTDPQILTKKSGFMSGDIGLKGIACFINEHTCNDICTNLKLRNITEIKFTSIYEKLLTDATKTFEDKYNDFFYQQ